MRRVGRSKAAPQIHVLPDGANALQVIRTPRLMPTLVRIAKLPGTKRPMTVAGTLQTVYVIPVGREELLR